jgi:serine/threonine protein kinase
MRTFAQYAEAARSGNGGLSTSLSIRERGLLLFPTRAPLTAEALNSRFRQLRVVGSGAFGEVSIVHDNVTGQFLTVKRMFNTLHAGRSGIGVHRTIYRELLLLQSLQHENIVPLLDYCVVEDGTVLFFMPTIAHDLHGVKRLWNASGQRPPLAQIKCIVMQLLKAVAHLHERGIVHRDIKSNNVLVDRDGRVKLIDFGWSRFLPLSKEDDLPLTGPPCAVHYRPPEILIGGWSCHHYGTAIDVWCAGLVLHDLCTREKGLFFGKTDGEVLLHIRRVLGPPPPGMAPAFDWSENHRVDTGRRDRVELLASAKDSYPLSSELRQVLIQRGIDSCGADLACQMLAWDPRDRATARQCLEHRWFHAYLPKPCEPSELSLPTANAFRRLQ